MTYKVEYLDSCDRVINSVFVEAANMNEAFQKASDLYDDERIFSMEIPREYAFNI